MPAFTLLPEKLSYLKRRRLWSPGDCYPLSESKPAPPSWLTPPQPGSGDHPAPDIARSQLRSSPDNPLAYTIDRLASALNHTPALLHHPHYFFDSVAPVLVLVLR
jgi:hypothetical protein